MKNIITTIILAFSAICVNAQETVSAEATASLMRSNGKIYVVVAVLLTILIGLFVYLIRIDQKITRLEKE